jgi:hypothetical protein
MCDGVAEEETETLQVVDSGCWASDDFLSDCHYVELIVYRYDVILVCVDFLCITAISRSRSDVVQRSI